MTKELVNDNLTMANMRILWRKENGVLPPKLRADSGNATSTIKTLSGDLLLKRGFADAAMMQEIVSLAASGKIKPGDILTLAEARAALPPREEPVVGPGPGT